MAAAPSDHLNSLDGLRGLAALIVMVAHSAYAYRDNVEPTGLLSSGLRMLYRISHPAVVLFFVLSGFVLYVAFWRKPVPYVPYLVRRLFRIYPALLVGIGVALCLHLLQAPTVDAGLGPWTTANWVFPSSLQMIVRHALMLGILKTDTKLDPVMWSLVIELRFSIVFMALAWLCRRSPWALLALSLVAYAASLALIHALGMHAPFLVGGTALGALAITLFYLPGFSFGILGAHLFLSRPAGRARRIPPLAQLAIVAVSLGVAKVAGDDFIWAAAFAVLIFIAALQGPVRAALSLGPALFLGRISYSLYLIHFPILMATIYAMRPFAPMSVPVLLAPILSIVLATGMHRWVELPGIELGRRVASRMARRAGAEPARDPNLRSTGDV